MFPSYKEAKQYEKQYNMIPICKEIYADVVTPISLLRRLKEIDTNYYLLESVEGGKQWGRYSFMGVSPLLQIRCKNGFVTMKSGAMQTTEKQDPMDALRKLLQQYRSPKIEGMPSFTGGLVGYFSYEMIGYAEPKLHLKENQTLFLHLSFVFLMQNTVYPILHLIFLPCPIRTRFYFELIGLIRNALQFG